MLRVPLLLCPAIALAHLATAQVVPTGFVVDTLSTTGLQTPNDLCFLPDGRVLIANSAGTVSLYAGGSVVTIGTVPSVESGGERGLLSIAADPDFPANGYVYVYYSSTADAFMHLDRFTCNGDRATPTSTNLSFAAASRRAVLGTLPDNAGNHNGGSVRFGPDGMLYLSVGDDAAPCSAQVPTSQVGCLLRLSVGSLPAGGSATPPSFAALDPGTNPLSANDDFSQLVIAYGLRNPFRMEIDPWTGSLYLGDVGENSAEEYSEYAYPAGALPLVNFGWPWREGAIAGPGCGGTPPAGLTQPLATVSHSAGWQAIMGGARYRNVGGVSDFGPGYAASAFFLDFALGELRRLEYAGAWGPAPAVPGQPDSTNWGTGFQQVTSLRLGPDGALWLTQRAGTGALKRIGVSSPASATDLGGGCVSSGGSNTLSIATQPWAEDVLVTTGTGLPGTAWVISVISFQTLVPPLSLASVLPQALPGCDLRVAPDILQASPTTTGTVTVQTFLPNSPTLIGQTFFDQMVVIETDASGSFLEITSTNALALTVGGH